MIIPYYVDVPYDRRPVVNILILLGMVLVFAVQYSEFRAQDQQIEYMSPYDPNWLAQSMDANGLEDPNSQEDPNNQEDPNSEEIESLADTEDDHQMPDTITEKFALEGWGFKGLMGHMWLHGGLLHLFGNALFLFVFGNAVCAKIGNIRYAPAYLAFGLFSAFSHLIFSGSPMIGASGAINGVVGMFLVFFPENEVSCFWTFGFVSVSLSSYWIILWWFAWDVFMAVMFPFGNVAYYAHVGGFVSGVALGVIMLKAKWVGVERYEKSLLQLMGLEKEESVNSFANPQDALMFLQQQQQMRESGNLVGNSDAALKEAIPEAEIFFAADQPEELIRFMCPCGKRLKVPGKFAGRNANCTKCGQTLEIPQQSQIQPVEQSQPAQQAKPAVIRFACSCGKRFRVPVKMAGRTARCPQCNSKIIIPKRLN